MRTASVKVERGFAKLRDGREHSFSVPANLNWRLLLRRIGAGDRVELKPSYACYAPSFRREVESVRDEGGEIIVRLTSRPAWDIRIPNPPEAIRKMVERAETA